MSCSFGDVTNFICSKDLNYHQIKSLLENNFFYDDVVCFTAVCWLSICSTWERFFYYMFFY